MATIESIKSINPYTKEEQELKIPTNDDLVRLFDNTTLRNWMNNMVDKQSEICKLIARMNGSVETTIAEITKESYTNYSDDIIFSSYVSSTFTTCLYRYACFTFFELNITFTGGANRVKLGTVPIKGRPVKSVSKNGITNGGVPVYTYVDDDGSFGTAKITSGNLGTDGIRETLFYVN